MKRTVYRYRFEKDVPMKEAHDSLLLSVIGAECLHGEARVRMEADYRFSRARRTCVVDASGPVGTDICRLFTGFASREFGRDSFTVERIERPDAPQPEPITP